MPESARAESVDASKHSDSSAEPYRATIVRVRYPLPADRGLDSCQQVIGPI